MRGSRGRYLPRVLVSFIVESIAIYALLGLAFAVGFAARGAATIDPVARGASWGFRILVVPGAALLWPLLAWRWWSACAVEPGSAHGGASVPGDRTDLWQQGAERLRSRALLVWIVLAPLIALVLVVALRGRTGEVEPSRDAARIPAAARVPAAVELGR